MRLIGGLDADRLVVVDEMGSNLALTPLYARAPKGQRAYGSVPRNHGKITTLVAALTPQGMGPALTLQGAVDTLSFVAYVREFLCPVLCSGQIVLLDNLYCHTDPQVRHSSKRTAARCSTCWRTPRTSRPLRTRSPKSNSICAALVPAQPQRSTPL